MSGLAFQELYGIRKARQGGLCGERHPDNGSHTTGDTQELKQAEAESSGEVAQE